MKKIITQGQTKFVKNCPHCGCQFEYELEDIQGNVVTCPQCEYSCIHYGPVCGEKTDISIPPYPTEIPCKKPNIVWATSQPVGSCENCPVTQRMRRGEGLLDDSCYWCTNNPYRVTCDSSSILTK